MGGGGSNSSPPVDVAPGGGTYPVNASGEAYNPAWGNQGFNWGAVGHGIQQGAAQYAQGVNAGAQGYSPGSGGYQTRVGRVGLGGVQSFLIPESQRKSDETRALLDALRRMQATQAAKSIVPDEGAAKYWYVDPNAGAPTDAGNLGLLPQGAQPSF